MAIASSHTPTPSSPILPWRSASDWSLKRLRENPPSEHCWFGGLVHGGSFGSAVMEVEDGSPVRSPASVGAGGGAVKARRRPTMLVIPGIAMACNSAAVRPEMDDGGEGLEMEGDGYCMASRRGSSKLVMEDGYDAITNIGGDPKQAYFGVFDGHGRRAAVDFMSQRLGKNIIKGLHERPLEEENAIRTGYLTTDQDFLSMNLGSGVCAATLLLKDGKLHSANAGDCRAVLSRNGVVQALTSDHRAARDDERQRIENAGGLVKCYKGVWRVEKSLSITRAIGDLHMKDLIISEPEISTFLLTSDCDFAILASDGLWDKVTDQEAVDVVLKGGISMRSCRELIELSSTRGSRDDISILLIYLKKFLKES